jgi:nicotinamide-nucleotide amidase
MPPTNLRQAEHPQGAELIDNPKGTAPGLRLRWNDTWIYALPGVPAELYPMLDDVVLPHLGAGGVVHSRVLRTWGESESGIADRLGDLYDGIEGVTLAFLASSGEIKLRLTAAADSAQGALAAIAPVEAEIRSRLGDLVFGSDDESIERLLVSLLVERGWSLGTAESATAGRVAAAITTVAGASRVFRGAIVPYATDLKSTLLAVSPELLDDGVVSEETAIAMARGAASALGADVVVAVTGSAGPDPQERPVGTMVIAVLTPEAVRARTLRLPGDRERVLTYATTAALQLTRLAVVGAWSEERWGPTSR